MTTSGPEFDTFPKWLLHNAGARGQRPAIRQKRRGIWRTTTWAEMAREAGGLAAALQERGFRRGATVAFLSDNRPRLYTGVAAVQALGGVAMPLYHDASADALGDQIARAKPTVVFAQNQEQVDKILQILPRCPSITSIIFDEDRGMRHYTQAQVASYESMLNASLAKQSDPLAVLRLEAEKGTGGDHAFLFWTSGTSGAAKGVLHTHDTLVGQGRALAAEDQLGERDTTVAYLPPGWMFQMLVSYIQPMVAGLCVCCPESSDTLFMDIREIAPTYLMVTPRILDAIMSQASTRIEETGGFNLGLYNSGLRVARRIGAARYKGGGASLTDALASKIYEVALYGPLRDALGMSKIRAAYSTGDLLDPDMLIFFRSLGINLKQLYGTTETGPFVAMHRSGAVQADSVGMSAPGVELQLTQAGEILVHAAPRFRGYVQDTGSTADALTPDGWFRTGDIGYLGQDGHLHLVDRAGDAGTLADGTPYAPKAIENKLKRSPFVREAIAVSDGRRIGMMIDIDTTAVGRWADTHEVTYSGHVDLATRDEVYGLIGDLIASANRELAQDRATAGTQIARFVLLPHELTADDGLLTRTGKLRRHAIAEAFEPVIDALFEGRSDVAFASGAGAGEIHHGAATQAMLKIRDASLAPSSDRRAA